MADTQEAESSAAPTTAAQDEKARRKEERKALAKRLRTTLLGGALTLPEMVGAVEAKEEDVLRALRRLRKTRKHGRLRSGIVSGSACWWWEPKH
jgi:hypothetical protein